MTLSVYPDSEQQEPWVWPQVGCRLLEFLGVTGEPVGSAHSWVLPWVRLTGSQTWWVSSLKFETLALTLLDLPRGGSGGLFRDWRGLGQALHPRPFCGGKVVEWSAGCGIGSSGLSSHPTLTLPMEHSGVCLPEAPFLQGTRAAQRGGRVATVVHLRPPREHDSP